MNFLTLDIPMYAERMDRAVAFLGADGGPNYSSSRKAVECKRETLELVRDMAKMIMRLEAELAYAYAELE